MLRITVKKKVFVCLVVFIIMILSFYNFCERNPQQCVFQGQEIPHISVSVMHFKSNRSKTLSGHEKWIPTSRIHTPPIDTLKDLLKKDNRAPETSDPNFDSKQLLRMERVDFDEVRKEQDKMEEADKEIEPTAEDGISFSLKTSGHTINKNASGNAFAPTRRKHTNLVKEDEIQRYERIDRTVLDPGSMSKDDLKEYYHKGSNGSAVFMYSLDGVNDSKATSLRLKGGRYPELIRKGDDVDHLPETLKEFNNRKYGLKEGKSRPLMTGTKEPMKIESSGSTPLDNSKYHEVDGSLRTRPKESESTVKHEVSSRKKHGGRLIINEEPIKGPNVGFTKGPKIRLTTGPIQEPTTRANEMAELKAQTTKIQEIDLDAESTIIPQTSSRQNTQTTTNISNFSQQISAVDDSVSGSGGDGNSGKDSDNDGKGFNSLGSVDADEGEVDSGNDSEVDDKRAIDDDSPKEGYVGDHDQDNIDEREDRSNSKDGRKNEDSNVDVTKDDEQQVIGATNRVKIQDKEITKGVVGPKEEVTKGEESSGKDSSGNEISGDEDEGSGDESGSAMSVANNAASKGEDSSNDGEIISEKTTVEMMKHDSKDEEKNHGDKERNEESLGNGITARKTKDKTLENKEIVRYNEIERNSASRVGNVAVSRQRNTETANGNKVANSIETANNIETANSIETESSTNSFDDTNKPRQLQTDNIATAHSLNDIDSSRNSDVNTHSPRIEARGHEASVQENSYQDTNETEQPDNQNEANKVRLDQSSSITSEYANRDNYNKETTNEIKPTTIKKPSTGPGYSIQTDSETSRDGHRPRTYIEPNITHGTQLVNGDNRTNIMEVVFENNENKKRRNKKGFRKSPRKPNKPGKKSNQKYIGLLKFKKFTCNRLNPKILLYNRIFKTGSTSLNFYMIETGRKRKNFKVRIGTTEDWYKTGDSHPYPEDIEKFAKQSSRYKFYTAHFFFRDNLKIRPAYTYINQVRDPVQRIISHFYYMKQLHDRPKHRIQEMIKSGYINETLEQCIEKQHRGCENNVMTHFFCGTEPYCSTGSAEAVKKAKYNMLHRYAAIGLLERLDEYLKILKLRLPKFFPSSRRTLTREKANEHSSGISLKMINHIKTLNRADYEIYEYAEELFEKQLEACKERLRFKAMRKKNSRSRGH